MNPVAEMISADKEHPIPVIGKIFGTLPEFVDGSLIINGPGLFEIGQDKYNHLFDGLALIHRYDISNGQVKYNSQFVKSDSYMRNKTANRIVVSEFGTASFPDPCKSIFDRLSSVFHLNLSDNPVITIMPIGDDIFTASEVQIIHRVDPTDLTTLGSARLNKVVSIFRATAHFHQDPITKVTFVLGFINIPQQYAFVAIPPISKKQADKCKGKYDIESVMKGAKIVGKINSRMFFYPSYIHSFAITDNYFILLESPETLSIPKLITSQIGHKPLSTCFKWWKQLKTNIRIISRKTGKSVYHKYITESMFTFHHINAYEDNGNIIIDTCAYKNGDIIRQFYSESSIINYDATPKRLIVPLDVDKYNKGDEFRIMANQNNTAKIIKENELHKKTVYVSLETLWEVEFELPSINYQVYNGKKYRFCYGTTASKVS